MKKYILLTLSLIILFTNISIISAENINGKEYKNLDQIEVVGYYHPSYLHCPMDTIGGGIGDWRFSKIGFFGLNEYKNLSENVYNKKFSWYNISIGVLNNLFLEKKDDYGEAGGGGGCLSDGHFNIKELNKTGSGEFILLPSRNFLLNLEKNSIFNNPKVYNVFLYDVFNILQDKLKDQNIRIIGKYYKIKGNYSFDVIGEKQNINMDLNIILVDNISLDTKITETINKEKPKIEIINEKIKLYEDKITKNINSISDISKKISKIDLFVKVLSSDKYRNNQIIIELIDFLKKLRESIIDDNSVESMVRNLFR